MRNTTLSLPLLGLLLVAIPAHARAEGGAQPLYAGYKSWLLACDNSGACIARGFPLDGGPELDLTITRGAGAEDAITATLRAEATFDLHGLTLDGAPLRLGAGWRLQMGDGETSLAATGLSVVRAFAQQIRNGTTLGLGAGMAVPLDGFAAILLRMDAAQARVGGTTALLTPGSKPASSVPPPAALPVVALHPVAARLDAAEAARLIAVGTKASAQRMTKEECETPPDDVAPDAHALSKTEALVLLPCLFGAYQTASLGILVDRRNETVSHLDLPLSFAGNPAPDDPTDMLTEPDFAPTTGTLSMQAKGRGLADCGIAASWIWDGTRFELAALTYQGACGGAEPGDWPGLYRSRP